MSYFKSFPWWHVVFLGKKIVIFVQIELRCRVLLKCPAIGNVRVALEIKCDIVSHIVTSIGSRAMMCDIFHPCSHNLPLAYFLFHNPILSNTPQYSWSCNPSWSRELLENMTNERAADETTAVLRTWPPSFGSSYAGQSWRLHVMSRTRNDDFRFPNYRLGLLLGALHTTAVGNCYDSFVSAVKVSIRSQSCGQQLKVLTVVIYGEAAHCLKEVTLCMTFYEALWGGRWCIKSISMMCYRLQDSIKGTKKWLTKKRVQVHV